MDRLRVNINGTDYDLTTIDQTAVTWDLTTWNISQQDTAKYWSYGSVNFQDIPDSPGAIGFPYGTYIIMLSNGMYLTLDYSEHYDIYEDYLDIFGLYNPDASHVGDGSGYSGANYTDLKIYGIKYGDYYGIVLKNSTDSYRVVYLFNSDIYDGDVIPPYEHGPEDPIQDGWGEWDRSTDQVGANLTPSSVIPFNAGVNMYVLNAAALNSFVGFLWGSDESLFAALWSRLANYMFNPIGAVVACHALPSEFMPSGTTTTAIQLAGTALFPISGTLKKASTQFIDQSYSLTVSQFYGDWMDYTNTRIILHLPFCGVAVLDPVYLVGGSLTVLYRCDVCTGNVSAFILCTNRDGRTELIQCAGGNCAYSVPLTGHSDGMIEALGSAAGLVAGGVATAMTGVPMSGGGNATDILFHKESTTVTGQMGGSSAITTSLDLYLEIVYAEPSNPSGYTALRGRPSDIGGTVGSFSGFTVFSDVHADGIARATDTEKRMIEDALRQGVII